MMFRKLKDTDIQIIIEFANNDMDVSKTSRQIFLHRNSIVYRLKKIERLTGLNPFRFYDLIQLLQLIGIIVIKCDCFKTNSGEINES